MITNIFSKRQRRLPDVYTYDSLPETLRVQIIQIWEESIGSPNTIEKILKNSQRRWVNPEAIYKELATKSESAYRSFVEALRHEYGYFRLTPENFPHREESSPHTQEFMNFFFQEENIDRALDAIELSFRFINGRTREQDYLYKDDASVIADQALEELNHRFREHGVGYRFEVDRIIRIDSEFLHAEVVRPALHLLKETRYSGAQSEFLEAHRHYRTGNFASALSECLKAFESVMKVIVEKRGWSVGTPPTASRLVDACLKGGLIPSFWQSQYNALGSLLRDSVPAGRNNLGGGHGQGSSEVKIQEHIVAYMLHMTAAAIVFLGRSDSSLPKRP